MATNDILSAPHPRAPNAEERGQLVGWLLSQGHEMDTATEFVDTASVAVFDQYVPDTPGYAGKLAVVVWGGGPGFHDVFVWDNGKMTRHPHDRE